MPKSYYCFLGKTEIIDDIGEQVELKEFIDEDHCMLTIIKQAWSAIT